jgi:phosphatidylserine decarboxylase
MEDAVVMGREFFCALRFSPTNYHSINIPCSFVIMADTVDPFEAAVSAT